MATPNVKLSFGPMLLGVFINMILYGVLLVQTTFYYQTYRRDSLWMRCFVGYLFLLCTANTGINMYMMYQPLILLFGSPEATRFFPPLFLTEPAIIVCISTPIQAFFAWRIWKITKSMWIPLVICVMALTSFAGGVWTTAMVAIVKLFSRKSELHWCALMWFLASCIADVLITATLVRSLSQRKTGFVATDSVIDKIIRMTVQTGMVTAFFAIADVVFFMSLEGTALNFIWDLALTKLYVNCLLSTLNSRAALNHMSGTPASGNRNFQIGEGMSTVRRHDPISDSYIPNHTSSRMDSNLYELEHHTKSLQSQHSSDRDLEFGITVTKVVETVEDPVPRSARLTL